MIAERKDILLVGHQGGVNQFTPSNKLVTQFE